MSYLDKLEALIISEGATASLPKLTKPGSVGFVSTSPDPSQTFSSSERPDGDEREPLSAADRAALDRLAAVWGMDAEERAVMLRQCEEGGELVDGSWISPEEVRAFWLSEAGVLH